MKPIFQEHQCLSEGNIEGYLSNRLSLEERHRVENHMLDCPLCSDAVDGYDLLRADSKSGKETEKKPVRMRVLNWRFFSAAAAVIILLAAVVWIYPKQYDTDQLFASYYASYNSDLDIRFRQTGIEASPADTPLTRGLQAYAAQDYSRSISQLEEFLQANPNHLVSRFYLALAQMEEGREAEAIKNFSTVQMARQEYWEESSWYLALLYVKSNQPEQARELLNTLISPGSGRYYEQAKDLTSKL
ncbi:MAG: tetratricopeptide repeat protein [Saprospirales bacterium]|nr:tetratricopeptide repeat protein [Saprospirales bacterium]MBK8489612.1 tetratricopeptide repeat protein [Saprospirales bacterium]